MAEPKLFTLDEVRSKSDGHDNTLIVIHDKVYNVTSFLNEHPGGEEILIEHAGKDATEDFVDVNHSADAIELMAKYLVGEIVPEERRNLAETPGWKAGYSSENPEKDKYVSGPGAPFLLLVGAMLLAVVAVLYLVK